MCLGKDKRLSGDFSAPVWELWPSDISKEEYMTEVAEPMDLKTLHKMVQEGGWAVDDGLALHVLLEATDLKTLHKLVQEGGCIVPHPHCPVFQQQSWPLHLGHTVARLI